MIFVGIAFWPFCLPWVLNKLPPTPAPSSLDLDGASTPVSQRLRLDRTASTRNSFRSTFTAEVSMSTQDQINVGKEKKKAWEDWNPEWWPRRHTALSTGPNKQGCKRPIRLYTFRFQLPPGWQCIAKSHVRAYTLRKIEHSSTRAKCLRTDAEGTRSTVRKRCVVVRPERSVYCEHSRVYCKPSFRVRCVRRRRRRTIPGQRRPLLRCWGLAPCSMSLTLSARASGGHRFVRLDPPSSCFEFISIFACQGDHDSSAESCMRMQNWKPYLNKSSYSNKQRRLRLQLEEF